VKSGDRLQTFKAHSDAINSVAISADAKIVASCSDDKTIGIWEVRSGALLQKLTGHTNWVLTVALSADASTVASGSADGSVGIWNVREGSRIATMSRSTSHVISVALSADTSFVACSYDRDEPVGVWKMERGPEPRKKSAPNPSVWAKLQFWL
jgi:WD40 repeat protein